MKRSITVAAFAALVAFASVGTAAAAGPGTLSAADAEMCKYLEMAHETTCAEFEAVLAAKRAAAGAIPGLVDPSETTGSVRKRFSSDPENFEPQMVPIRR